MSNSTIVGRCPAMPMSEMGQKRRFGDVSVTSALPLKADIHRKGRHVSNVPEADLMSAPVPELTIGLTLIAAQIAY